MKFHLAIGSWQKVCLFIVHCTKLGRQSPICRPFAWYPNKSTCNNSVQYRYRIPYCLCDWAVEMEFDIVKTINAPCIRWRSSRTATQTPATTSSTSNATTTQRMYEGRLRDVGLCESRSKSLLHSTPSSSNSSALEFDMASLSMSLLSFHCSGSNSLSSALVSISSKSSARFDTLPVQYTHVICQTNKRNTATAHLASYGTEVMYAEMCPRGQVLRLKNPRGQMPWLGLNNQVLGLGLGYQVLPLFLLL